MDAEKQTPCSNIDDFIKNCLENISKMMKNANSLPLADYDYWAIEKSFTDAVDVQRSQMINMIQYILSKHGFKNRLSVTMDEEDILACVTSICDQLMERINSNLDEAAGKKPSSSLLLVSKVATPKTDVTAKFSLMTQKSIPKPQGSFKDKVDNSDLPFKPPITYKPNALKPLEDSLVLENGEYSHPYLFELESLKVDETLLQRVEPMPPQSLDQTPFTYIDKQEQLEDLANKLTNVSEIAIDLEHHSFRTYQGFTCLMQLSTRHQDFIIDTLLLRHHMHLLSPAFTDPRIVKVLHGSDSDIEWLQKDFGLYIVNSFDTGQAARLLQLPHLSLSYLLQTICDVTADKQFQKADWRIRELPDVYLKYAREDTHYLLYIYDVIKNMLIEKERSSSSSGREKGGDDDDGDGGRSGKDGNLLYQAFVNSNEICKKRYKKPSVKPKSHLELYQRRMGRGGGALSTKGVEVLKRLYAWRDKLARIEDESTGYILPDEIMFQIAQTLPLTEAAILQCCKTYIPPTLKRQLEDIKIVVNDVVTFGAPSDKADDEATNTPLKRDDALRSLPAFNHQSFDPCDYDDSFLDSKSKVNSAFESSFLHEAEQTPRLTSYLNKLNKIFLPYLPVEMLPKDYKATFKVKFMEAVAVETTVVPKVTQLEVIKTAEEIKLSTNTVSLKTKIKSATIEESSKATPKKTEENNDIKANSPTTNKIAKINLKKNTNNKEKDGDFQAKVYMKKEFKGILKEGEKKGKGGGREKGKGEGREKRSYDPNDDLADLPTPAKQTRKNFHRSNKSHTFMPRK